jgi:hypothetical protein
MDSPVGAPGLFVALPMLPIRGAQGGGCRDTENGELVSLIGPTSVQV